MLVIVKRLSAQMRRPKYSRILAWPMYCVWDTDKKETVFGPNSWYKCSSYISDYTQTHWVCSTNCHRIPRGAWF
jgi:hypothetical protein